MAIALLNIFSLLCLAVVAVVAEREECRPARCGDSGPEVQFPFWLEGHQPRRCGYTHPDFGLSCSSRDTSLLEFRHPIPAFYNNSVFPLGVKAEVLDIDYYSQSVFLATKNANYCLPSQLPTAVNSQFASPFEIYGNVLNEFSLFNCSSPEKEYSDGLLINCLSGGGYRAFAFPSDSEISDQNVSSCTKMYDFYRRPFKSYSYPYMSGLAFPSYAYRYMSAHPWFSLRWSVPSREDCEARGKSCRSERTEPVYTLTPERNGASRKSIIAGVIGTLFLLSVIFLASLRFVSLKKKKEDQTKIEKFLADYKALRPTRFSYADIKKITNKFNDKLGEGGYGTVYKGNLSNDILVAVKVLNNFKGNGEEFINEVGTIGTIHHKNVVRLVGYCADGYRRALIYEFLPNDSLEKLISTRKQIHSLGWEKLQQIAIGIAKGLEYLHQGCNQRILHFDIKPQNILLDHNFNPKVADFGLAKLCSKDQSAVSMTAARGTIGYIAPEVFSRNFGNVSYKSDVYSFGMLLLDMVGGRKRFQAVEGESSQMYYPEWMYKQLEKGEEVEIQIDKEEDSRIFKKLSIVGLWCIQWCPADRPSMKVAIQMLEGENMPAMPPNPFAATEPTKANALKSGSCRPSDSEIYSINETT